MTVRLVDGNNTHALEGRLEVDSACNDTVLHVQGNQYPNYLSLCLSQVWHNGEWGTICCGFNMGFQDPPHVADVACHHMGMRYGRTVSIKPFGQGTGNIWLELSSCSGAEGAIEDCHRLSHWTGRDWGAHFCTHEDDIAIQCGNEPLPGGPGWVCHVKLQ